MPRITNSASTGRMSTNIHIGSYKLSSIPRYRTVRAIDTATITPNEKPTTTLGVQRRWAVMRTWSSNR